VTLHIPNTPYITTSFTLYIRITSNKNRTHSKQPDLRSNCYTFFIQVYHLCGSFSKDILHKVIRQKFGIFSASLLFVLNQPAAPFTFGHYAVGCAFVDTFPDSFAGNDILPVLKAVVTAP
jgi:hypothetical protein